MKQMRNILKIVLLSTIIIAFVGCKKIENQYPSKVVKVSYPTIILKGDEAVSIHVGDPYTDAGATLTDDITGANSNLEGDASAVDITTEGLYFVRFSASNANGYVTTIVRPVAVTDIENSFNISGEYFHAARGGTAILSKISRGLFVSDNLNGGGNSSGSIFMMIRSDSTLDVPMQWSNDGGFDGDYLEEELVLSPDTNYSYAISAPGFGASARLFEKQ